jgi:hypothetical protein
VGCVVSEQPTYLPSARRPRPGRPRKADLGHVPGTSALQHSENAKPNGGVLASQAIAPMPPRLLDLGATASYLGVSGWTVRDLEAAGTLRRVRIPLPDGGELRKLLFDRSDLDRLVEAWKDRP